MDACSNTYRLVAFWAVDVGLKSNLLCDCIRHLDESLVLIYLLAVAWPRDILPRLLQFTLTIAIMAQEPKHPKHHRQVWTSLDKEDDKRSPASPPPGNWEASSVPGNG